MAPNCNSSLVGSDALCVVLHGDQTHGMYKPIYSGQYPHIQKYTDMFCVCVHRCRCSGRPEALDPWELELKAAVPAGWVPLLESCTLLKAEPSLQLRSAPDTQSRDVVRAGLEFTIFPPPLPDAELQVGTATPGGL